MTSKTRQLLQQRFDEAQVEKALIETQMAPVQRKLDAAAAEFEQARLKWQAAKEELIPKLKKVELSEVSQEISTLALALGGKRMSQG